MRTWTAEARAAQAQKIRAHKPWLHSTGPRTAAGKARVAINASEARQPRQHHQTLPPPAAPAGPVSQAAGAET